jgi:hypothetical protein
LSFGVLAGLSLPIWRGAETIAVGAQHETENAAVKYLRADASLRQSYALSPDAAMKLLKAVESPLDAEDEKLVDVAEEALIEFRHGASLALCEWAMSEEDGALANTAHRGAIMELVAVAGLRARLRFRDGDAAAAMVGWPSGYGSGSTLVGRRQPCFGSDCLQAGECDPWSSRRKPTSIIFDTIK